jgi:hypothetical protein
MGSDFFGQINIDQSGRDKISRFFKAANNPTLIKIRFPSFLDY